MAPKLSQTDIDALNRAYTAANEPRRAPKTAALIVDIPGAKYKTLMGSNGELTLAGKYWYEQLADDEQPPGVFDEQKPQMKGNREFLVTRDGKKVVLRSWDGVLNVWRFTRAGKAFYRNAKTEYLVRIMGTYVLTRTSKGAGGNPSLWIEHGKWVPSTETSLGTIQVPTNWTQQRQLAAVERQTREWIGSHPSLTPEEAEVLGLEGDWKLIVPGGGSMASVYARVGDPLEYDKQSIDVHNDGTVDVNVVLHRPLRQGTPWDFGFTGCCHEAKVDSGGQCVPFQLEALLKKRGLTRETIERELDMIFDELYGADHDDNPYIIQVEDDKTERRSWREAGVTLAMVKQLASNCCIKVHACWGTAKVLSFVPEAATGSLCLHIWGDHAFFVNDRHTKSVLAKTVNKPTRRQPERVMAIVAKALDWPPSIEWKELQGNSIEEAINDENDNEDTEKKMKHFFHNNLHQLRAHLHERRLCPEVGLSGLGQIKTLTLPNRCTFHQNRRDVILCEYVASQVELRTGKKFDYFGESIASLAAKAFAMLCRPPHREYPGDEVYQKLLEQQGHICNKCGSPHEGHSFEIDHVVPRIAGGSDEIENLQLICKPCHVSKTTFEATSYIQDDNVLLSRFSLKTYEAFVKAQKPPQAVANISNKPVKQSISVDIRRCRYNAFVQLDSSSWELPIFSPVDEVKSAVTGCISDFQWIEVNPKQKSARQLFPYFGPGWYGASTAAFLLDAGIAQWDDFKLSFHASARKPANYVGERLQILEKLWREAAHLNNMDEDLIAKHASVALLGLWGSRDRFQYKMVTSSSPYDVHTAGPVSSCSTPGSPQVDGVAIYQDYVFKQHILELTSMRPIHQRCLEEERLQVARAMIIASRFVQPHQYIQSLRVDEMFCWVPNKNFKEQIKELRYNKLHEILPPGRKCVHQKPLSSDAYVFKCDVVNEPVYPGGQLELRTETRPAPSDDGEWNVIEESLDEDAFVDEIVQHVMNGKSCCVEGCAGTGKTEVLKAIEKAFTEQCGEGSVAKICLTHCGARNLGKGGETAHHFVMKMVMHGTFSGKAVLIDEISFMTLELLAALEHLRLRGVRMICFGDFEQLPPVSNIWRGVPVEPNVFKQSSLYKEWADSTRFVLRRSRRSDKEHFEFYTSIRSLPKEQGVQLALERYPPRNEEATWNLVLSHWRRKKINKRIQEKLAEPIPDEDKTWIEDAEVPCHIFRGTRLIGCNNEHSKITNGTFLTVDEVSGDNVVLIDDELDKKFTVNTHAVARHTRLRHALTLHSVQGRSLVGTIAIHDRKNKFFTNTMLYVALSRAKQGNDLWIV